MLNTIYCYEKRHNSFTLSLFALKLWLFRLQYILKDDLSLKKNTQFCMRKEMNQGHARKKISCLKWGSDMNSFRVKQSKWFEGSVAHL